MKENKECTALVLAPKRKKLITIYRCKKCGYWPKEARESMRKKQGECICGTGAISLRAKMPPKPPLTEEMLNKWIEEYMMKFDPFTRKRVMRVINKLLGI